MLNPRLLVLGAGGMLGHKVFQAAVRKGFPVAGTLRSKLSSHPASRLREFHQGRIIEGCDATDVASMCSLLKKEKPDVVVNCIGVIKQRPESSDWVRSITLNALLPHAVAELLSGWSGRLIHISTDCVFDGETGGYKEADVPNATDLYGKSKALGEVIYGNALTIRTSIIGRELQMHRSLLDWFLARNHSQVQGFANVWWSGVTTNHLADVVLDLGVSNQALRGLYHLSSGRISKFHLLCSLRDAFGLDIKIEEDVTTILDRSLDGQKFETASGYSFPGWPALLSQLTSDPTPYDTAVPEP